jgi:acyl transferase domain-containing protein/NAD(P)-dependent dehydrogenase (short-subunit alcohol dehydrogenase family)
MEQGIGTPGLPGDGNISAAELRASTMAFLRGIFAPIFKMQPDQVDSLTNLVDFGLTSVMVMQFNAAIDTYLPGLPKSLLFECKNLQQVADYLITEVGDRLVDQLGLAPAESRTPASLGQEAPVVGEESDWPELVPLQGRWACSSSEQAESGDIAIIGVSGRYPFARDLHEFWQNLQAGRDCVTEIPAERWDWRAYFDPDPTQSGTGKMYCKWGAFLQEADRFDPLFFAISPKEAETMDPQERIFLETAWAALEDAGYPPERLQRLGAGKGAPVGVFVGVTTNSYLLFGPEEWQKGNIVFPNSFPWSIANRVSYALNLQGPSIPVDTACSSSLTAIHLACESLRKGECTAALAGGVNLYLHPSKYVSLCHMRMLSPTGRPSSFGALADGFVPGEGAGAVLLKRLDTARADGDHIYAVIKGSALNHGGNTNGYTVPSPAAQADLIEETLRRAGVNPRTISYVEAHGTGTALGDPVEVDGLTKAYRRYTADTGYCALGSVKSNIGHLEAAAGIAGLTKILLQMRYRQLVPSLHAETLNPHVDFERTPFAVQHRAAQWQPFLGDRAIPRRAAISSFGAGGANAHLIVEEYPDVPGAMPEEGATQLVVLSGKSEDRLKAYAANVERFLRTVTESAVNAKAPTLRAVAYTLQMGRQEMEVRLAMVVSSLTELADALRDYVGGRSLAVPFYTGDLRTAAAAAPDRLSEQAGRPGRAAAEDLTGVARRWVAGAKVDWESVVTAEGAVRPQRVELLPTYPFARERYWISQVSAPAHGRTGLAAGLHPMIDANTSTLEEQRFSKVLGEADSYLRDHQVAGRMVLPAAAYLEMVRAAGAMSYSHGEVWKVKDVVWAAPVTLAAPEVAVQVSLFPTGEAVSFTVSSDDAAGEPVMHSQGSVEWRHEERAEWQDERLDLSAIMERCPTLQEGDGFYQAFAEVGFVYGPTLRAVRRIRRSQAEALVDLALPEPSDPALAQCVLHPALLDGALQAVIALIDRSEAEPGAYYLPFALGSLEIMAALPRTAHAFIRRTESQASMRTFQVCIADDQGRVLVRMNDFSLAAFRRETAGPVQPVSALYFRPVFSPAPLHGAGMNQGPVLLFDTDEAVYSAMGALEAGTPAVLVRPGTQYEQTGKQAYRIDPQEPEHYARLLAELDQRGLFPERILHLWSRCPLPSPDADAAKHQLACGFYSCFFLSRALVSHKQPVRLLYAHLSDGAGGEPAHQAVSGFVRTLCLEAPHIEAKTVQLSSADAAGVTAATLAQVARAEWAATAAGGEEVRYTGEVRQVRTLQEWPLATEGSREADTLGEEGSVWLIPGGTGGLGRLFAGFLARQIRARLVLAGRSAYGAAQERQLNELKELGAAEVLYLQADISRKADADRLVAAVRERFGRIDGLIHAAGVVQDSLILKKSREELDAVLAAKVFGTLHLDAALQSERLRYFVLCSSAAATVGNVGQSDYAFANSFLDHFAVHRSQSGRSGRTVAINWPLWAEGGMRVSEQVSVLAEQERGVVLLQTQTGLDAFAAALHSTEPNLLVLQGKADRIRGALAAVPVQPAVAGESRRPAEAPDNEVDNDLRERAESFLKQVLAGELKLAPERMVASEPLERYGIDSIMILSLTRELEKHFGALSKTLFFEYQTIAGLAGYFLERHREQLLQRIGRAPGARPSSGAPVPAAPAQAEHTVRPRFQRTGGPAPGARLMGHQPDAIAIVGVSGRYPMADTVDEFWENLKNGRDCITEIPSDRWDYRPLFDADKEAEGKVYSKWGGFVNDVDKFDPLFFNISPREAEVMDPQERLFLETVWHTLEDAGYTRRRIRTDKVGVFVGAMYGHYQLFGAEESLRGNVVALNSSFASIANRVSYCFHFQGPSIALDTMCSSSLTAIHLACDSLRKGESELAIAGGVNLTPHPNKYTLLAQGRFLASDGRCKSFGQGGDGYVPGEGVGAVLLKPLSKAVQDGDRIYAVIRATAVNHGGKVNGYSVPNPNAQAGVIHEALRQAQIDPQTISYIEAHGTGTSLGDPIEITGLTKAFQTSTSARQYCAIGSAKSNIGHLESAAGIAAVTKVLMQMKHKQLAPSIHSETLNPHIPFEQSPFFVQRELSPWEQPVIRHNGKLIRVPRRAGVSSFGAGGANAHLILEEYEPSARPNAGPVRTDEPHLIVLSARSDQQLQANAQSLLRFLERQQGGDAPPVDHDQTASLRQSVLTAALQIIAAQVGVDKEIIDPAEDLGEYGLDQVALMESVQQLQQRFGVELPVSDLIGYRTVLTLAAEVVRRLAPEGRQAVPPEGATPAFSLADIAYTLQVGREPMERRLALVVCSVAELREKLTAILRAGTASHGTYRGGTGPKQNDVGLLLGDREGEEFLHKLLRECKWGKLAQLWVNGAQIDWDLAYAGEPNPPARISLPAYCFARERYWVPAPHQGSRPVAVAQPAANQLHPLLGRNVSTLRAQKFETEWTGAEFFLTDHRIGHDHLVPGVAYLEMAAASSAIAGEARVFRILNAAWVEPLAVTAPVAVQVQIYPDGDTVAWEVTSSGAAGEVRVHARGQAEFSPSGAAARRIDLSDVRQRSHVHRSAAEIYAAFEQVGFGYGPSLRTLCELHVGQGEALARLELPAAVQAGFPKFTLHPSLLDGALQAVAGLIMNEADRTDRVYVPFAVGAVEILGALPAALWVHVRSLGDWGGGSLRKFDLSLTDDEGNPVVHLRDYAVRTAWFTASPVPSDDIALREWLSRLERGELSVEEVDLLTEGSL